MNGMHNALLAEFVGVIFIVGFFGACGDDAVTVGSALPDSVEGCTSGVFDCAGVCDGTAQEDCAGVCDGTAQVRTFYEDADDDGLGNPDVSQELCDSPAPEGFVLDDSDEDDGCQSNVFDCAGVCDGTAQEDCAGVCDGTAQVDCAGVCDGTAQVRTFYEDADDDGLGNPDVSQEFCDAVAPEGWVLNADDLSDDGVRVLGTFEFGSEGWMVILSECHDVSLLRNEESPDFNEGDGCSDEGYISYLDNDRYCSFFKAPEQALGDWSEFANGTLEFALKSNFNSYRNTAVLVLEGNGQLIVTRLLLPRPQWSPYTIGLSAENFTYGSVEGSVVSEEDFASVLADVTAMRINAEWGSVETTGLDNVRLVPAETGQPAEDCDPDPEVFRACGSCMDVLNANLSRGSGVYRLDPCASGRGHDFYCDMDFEGGGWTLMGWQNSSSTTTIGTLRRGEVGEEVNQCQPDGWSSDLSCISYDQAMVFNRSTGDQYSMTLRDLQEGDDVLEWSPPPLLGELSGDYGYFDTSLANYGLFAVADQVEGPNVAFGCGRYGNSSTMGCVDYRYRTDSAVVYVCDNDSVAGQKGHLSGFAGEYCAGGRLDGTWAWTDGVTCSLRGESYTWGMAIRCFNCEP